MHHPADLDMIKIVAEVRNVSREVKPISKRLFFNKELLYLGNLEFQTGDELKVSFAIQRVGSDGNILTIPFSEVDFIVTNEGLAPSVEGSGVQSSLTALQTWVANQATVPFNFTKETQFLDAYKKKK